MDGRKIMDIMMEAKDKLMHQCQIKGQKRVADRPLSKIREEVRMVDTDKKLKERNNNIT